ncbi:MULTISPECIES: hypothetical protein [Lysobacter]|uniref:Lipoprotein n=2 Tax=Lysobacter gummosus TaxID=262324 RepID=A0ABY3XCE2_9GAMM|nr:MULTISPECIES: hypothetical protein [Lysobacter]ALN93401.1 hypothetical protein LG3211_4467 [Lysobacter gummosus]UJB19892.1 hypothetical protein L1A79_01985 [Lysobacter capsici]UJQ26382.1 hypothetical protein L2D09_12875 [Lysobacter gummosus]UNP28867.1 hypothetical protein MOV92_20710 [Lysobacter gummosus]
MNTRQATLLLAAAMILAGCEKPDPKIAEAAKAAQQEQAAAAAAKDFDAAYAQKNWEMASAHGEIVTSKYPGTPTADRVRPLYEESHTKAKAAREQRRVESLWSYMSTPVKLAKGKSGTQLSASIYARANVETDGSIPRPVQLIFRDHPDWGRSSYLVLQTGDFDCYGGCKLKVTVDGKSKTMPGSRPKTDEAIAMFIEDERGLWRMIGEAKELSIEFPVKAGGKRTASFEVGGLNQGKLPGWR